MPEIAINLGLTDNDDSKVAQALEAHEAILLMMSLHVFDNETVECWVQRVKGKWDSLPGKMHRPEIQA